MTNRPLEQYLILSDGMAQTVVPGWDHHSKESEMLSQNLHQHLLSYLEAPLHYKILQGAFLSSLCKGRESSISHTSVCQT